MLIVCQIKTQSTICLNQKFCASKVDLTPYSDAFCSDRHEAVDLVQVILWGSCGCLLWSLVSCSVPSVVLLLCLIGPVLSCDHLFGGEVAGSFAFRWFVAQVLSVTVSGKRSFLYSVQEYCYRQNVFVRVCVLILYYSLLISVVPYLPNVFVEIDLGK